MAWGDAQWSLGLTAGRWPLVVSNATWLQSQRKWAAARRLLETRIDGLSAQDRALAQSSLARVDLGLGDEGGARDCLALSIPQHHAAGRVLDEADDAGLLAYLLIQRREFAAARQVLSALELPPGSPAEAVYYRHNYLGLLAEQVGDTRSALAELGAAAELATGVGMTREGYAADQVLGRLLQALGRSGEAAALFQRLSRFPASVLLPCDRADMLVNQAWSLLLAGEAGESRSDPIPLLAEAEGIARREVCPGSDEKRLNTFLNVTLAHLQARRPDLARVSLAEARPLLGAATPLDRLWSPELEARLELEAGHPTAALRWYERLDELAARASSREGLWRAAYGRAQCYTALGHTADALAASGRAEALLEEASLQIPIHEGRNTFAAQHERASNLYLKLLLDTGRTAEALTAARRDRSRFLRELARGDRLAHLTAAEQARWDRGLSEYWRRRAESDKGAGADRLLPADQRREREAARAQEYAQAKLVLDEAFTALESLPYQATPPPPRPGEVVLAYHPLPAGWVGFATDGHEVLVTRFDLRPALLDQPAQLAARLLTPFRSQIDRATKVRVLPYGALRAVDFHALPYGGRGQILLERCPIVYGLDLALTTQGRSLLAQGQGLHALLVANPTSAQRDLPAADAEAEHVAAALAAQRPAWQVKSLHGGAATADAVRATLPGVALLHYAGHGSFSGFGGWESELPLAGETRLTLRDLLALGRVPPWVVLSGCDTGKVGAEAPVEGLNLAHAFLLAGSRAVIAATRPVEDASAQVLFADLYQGWNRAPDLAVQLQRAQLAARRRHMRARDWESFRAFEP